MRLSMQDTDYDHEVVRMYVDITVDGVPTLRAIMADEEAGIVEQYPQPIVYDKHNGNRAITEIVRGRVEITLQEGAVHPDVREAFSRLRAADPVRT
jgi:hypothetical protein